MSSANRSIQKKCMKCNLEIKEERCIKAMGIIFHEKCLACYKCHTIIDDWYYPVNEKTVLCRKCVSHDYSFEKKLQHIVSIILMYFINLLLI